ncbi:hypothetical protein FOBRF1_004741 [Fusarium oxysporum]
MDVQSQLCLIIRPDIPLYLQPARDFVHNTITKPLETLASSTEISCDIDCHRPLRTWHRNRAGAGLWNWFELRAKE